MQSQGYLSLNIGSKTLTKKLRERLLKNYNLIQKQAINRNGQLEISSIIKHNVKFENYLRHLNLSQRLIISKLRLSDHNLPIEHGRNNNIPRHKKYNAQNVNLGLLGMSSIF